MKLPLFPLGMVMFPAEIIRLHIFEPRYKQLINDCVAEGLSFGIPSVIQNQITSIGTEAELLSIERIYPGGEMDIIVRGRRTFRIQEIIPSTPARLYLLAVVEWLSYDITSDPSLAKEIVTLATTLHELLRMPKGKIPSPDNLLSFDIGHFVGFSLEQEYELLCLLSEKERQQFIYAHLNKILPMVRRTEQLKQRIKSNGHFPGTELYE